MAEENGQSGPTGILETISLVFKAMRAALIGLNILMILFTLYFMIFGRNLGGEPLQMVTWLRWVLCLLVIITALFGIVVALWYGKKTKTHLKMIAGYLIAIALWVVSGVILASIYVREPTKYDIIFIVMTTFFTLIIVLSSLAFGYALKKTKMLRRFNVFAT